MRLNRTALMGGVAALALGVGTGGFAVEAEAFDDVKWKWDAFIDDDTIKTVDIDIDLNPLGDIRDQIYQIQIGDVRAYSKVNKIRNYKPYEQVTWQEGYKLESSLTVEGGYHYNIHGGGDITSYKNERFKHISRLDIDNSTTKTSSSDWQWKGELDGKVATSQEGDPPFFLGGAGYAAGPTNGTATASAPPPFGFASLSGEGEGEFVIGAIGAKATDGEAMFDSELSARVRESLKTEETELTSNEEIYEDIIRSSEERGYTYDFYGEGSFGFNVSLTAEELYTFYALAPKVQDAKIELPEVTSAAAAIGNLITVDGDVPVQEHSGQFLFDVHGGRKVGKKPEDSPQTANLDIDVDVDVDADVDIDYDVNMTADVKFENEVETNNYFHNVGLMTAFFAGAGLIKKADIYAESEVSDILNATAASTATAIGNYKSIAVDTINPDNGLVMADITQVSVADVRSKSRVYDINIVNYTNMGKINRDIATSTATSIGNAVSISVNSGQKAVGDP